MTKTVEVDQFKNLNLDDSNYIVVECCDTVGCFRNNHPTGIGDHTGSRAMIVHDPKKLRFEFAYVDAKYLIFMEGCYCFMPRGAPYICEVKSSP